MPRPVLPETLVLPSLRETVASYQQALLNEVREAVDRNQVVVVGMAQNPFPRKARKLLDGKGTAYTYLEYGSYFSQWRRRLALKMWSGWPTLPIIFVNGMLVGGATDLEKLIGSGDLDRMLAQAYPAKS